MFSPKRDDVKVGRTGKGDLPMKTRRKSRPKRGRGLRPSEVLRTEGRTPLKTTKAPAKRSPDKLPVDWGQFFLNAGITAGYAFLSVCGTSVSVGVLVVLGGSFVLFVPLGTWMLLRK